ncbi:MAG: hypothetical protein GWO41_17220, partial [candidate division Zixibacteria bacterium]|nr:hypothetical protein [candidate division Zixibacteria bacterium]NIW42957.1 hypothetical protein [candidate division Zixibacteria bacterium]NIX80986.1 hypothetical protein [candidate division Zixibacteria bacterium]
GTGLAANFRSRNTPRFFFNTEKIEWMEKIPEFFPAECERSLKMAEEILRDRYPVFADEPMDFGSPPNWFLEPSTGKISEPDFYDDIPYLCGDAVGDSRVVWELSRLKFIYPLGQAYILTGVDRYALKAFGILEDWFRRNPPGQGINWCSSLECAFRIYALIWTIELFRNIELLDDRFAELVWYYVYHLADHINSHLSFYFSPHTHLTGEAFGLFMAGLFFPELNHSEDFMTRGLEILEKELENQFTEEGAHTELSTCYHRYSLDFYMHTILLAELNNIPLPPLFREKTGQMAEYLLKLRRPDGLWPQLGDSDGGKLVWLEFDDARDCTASLSNAALLFNRREFNPGKARFESSWLFGISACREHNDKRNGDVKLDSEHMEDSGYAVLRSEDQRSYLLFDCGRFGSREAAHSHADALSFELVVGSEPVFIDPGTYCYTKDKSMRNYFRSAAAHNVCLVDDKGCADEENVFDWQYYSDAEVQRAILSKYFDFISAGVERKRTPGFQHRRDIYRIGDDYFIIFNKVVKGIDAISKFLFHTPFSSHSFSPGQNQIILESSQQRVILKPLSEIDYRFSAESGRENPLSGWYSRDYLVLDKINTLIIEPAHSANLEIPFCIFPSDKKGGCPEFKNLGSGCWSIRVKGFSDFWQFGKDSKSTFLRKDENSRVSMLFLAQDGIIEIAGLRYWESEVTAGLYGYIEDCVLFLEGEISGKCRLLTDSVARVKYRGNEYDVSINGRYVEFEI